MGEMHCVNGVCEMSSRKSSQMEALDAYIKSLPLADNPTRKRGLKLNPSSAISPSRSSRSSPNVSASLSRKSTA